MQMQTTYERDIIVNKVLRVLNVILKAIVIVIFIFPFYWMVSTSLKDLTEALKFPPTLIPSSLHWENYAHVFEVVPIAQYFKNSVIVSVTVLILQYLIIVPAACPDTSIKEKSCFSDWCFWDR